jgi:hypothetical protein
LGVPDNRGSSDLLGGETVADGFEEAFDFFTRYYGTSAGGKAMAAREGERDEVFSFFNGRGFGGFDSFTAEFLAELVGDGGEDRDGKGPIFLLEDSGFHNFSRYPRFGSDDCCWADDPNWKLLH